MVRTRKPAWWLVYLTVPLMIGLLLLDARMPYSLVVHRIAEMAIVLVSFGLMAVWVEANQAALLDEEMQNEHWILESDLDPEDPADHDVLPEEPAHSVDRPSLVSVSPNKGRYN